MPNNQVSTPRRYRKIDAKKRAMVVLLDGIEGFIVRWTGHCSGCTEYVEGQLANGPHGCEECGYHGVRRNEQWVPFDVEQFWQREASHD